MNHSDCNLALTHHHHHHQPSSHHYPDLALSYHHNHHLHHQPPNHHYPHHFYLSHSHPSTSSNSSEHRLILSQSLSHPSLVDSSLPYRSPTPPSSTRSSFNSSSHQHYVQPSSWNLTSPRTVSQSIDQIDQVQQDKKGPTPQRGAAKQRRMFKRTTRNSSVTTNTNNTTTKRTKSRKSSRDSSSNSNSPRGGKEAVVASTSSTFYSQPIQSSPPSQSVKSTKSTSQPSSAYNFGHSLSQVKKEDHHFELLDQDGDHLGAIETEDEEDDFLDSSRQSAATNLEVEEENAELKMIMNMASTSDHHHHHHLLHHHEHSNYIADLLGENSSIVSPESEDVSAKSARLILQDVENVARSPPYSFYSAHHHYSPSSNHGHHLVHHHHHPSSQSYNPLYPQHVDDNNSSGTGGGGSVMQNLMDTYQKMCYHGLGGGGGSGGNGGADHSPLPATSATSMVLPPTNSSSAASPPSSHPPPSNAIINSKGSQSPTIKRNYADYTELDSFESYHHELISDGGSSKAAVDVQATNLVNGSLVGAAAAATQNGLVVPMKMPLQDHNSQQGTTFNENVCFGCRETLSTSRIIVSVSGYHNWHTKCLSCSECHQSLCQSRSCYIRNGRMYCKEDYWKLVKCSKCSRQISASDWVRRAGDLVYHLACFACDLCQRQLSTGENFTIVRQTRADCRLLCKLHFSVKSDEICNSDVDRSSPGAQTGTATGADNAAGTGQPNGSTGSTGAGSSSAGGGVAAGSLTPTGTRAASSSSSSLSGGSSSKTKRVRTTFTEDQLQVLQANFQLDSNPDGQDLERIAALTGLSKRVTQVWFQNSRARQKKYMNKSHQRLLGSGVGGQGVRAGTPGAVAMLMNGGRPDSNTGLWSPASSTGSSMNDCLSLPNPSSITLEHCLSANPKWGQNSQTANNNNQQSSGNANTLHNDSNASHECSESSESHSLSPPNAHM